MLTERHADGGFGGVGICAALYYFYMSMVEHTPTGPDPGPDPNRNANPNPNPNPDPNPSPNPSPGPDPKQVEDMPTEHPADRRPAQGSVGAKDVRLRDLRKLTWSSHLTRGWDTTDNLLGFMSRPWFSTVVGSNGDLAEI